MSYCSGTSCLLFSSLLRCPKPSRIAIIEPEFVSHYQNLSLTSLPDTARNISCALFKRPGFFASNLNMSFSRIREVIGLSLLFFLIDILRTYIIEWLVLHLFFTPPLASVYSLIVHFCVRMSSL